MIQGFVQAGDHWVRRKGWQAYPENLVGKSLDWFFLICDATRDGQG